MSTSSLHLWCVGFTLPPPLLPLASDATPLVLQLFRKGPKTMEGAVKGVGVQKAEAMLRQLEEELRVGHGVRMGGSWAMQATGATNRQSDTRHAHGHAGDREQEGSAREILHANAVRPASTTPTSELLDAVDFVELRDDVFTRAVLRSPETWVVFFWKVGCRACKAFKPEFVKCGAALEAVGVRVGMMRSDNTRTVGLFRLPGFPAIAVCACWDAHNRLVTIHSCPRPGASKWQQDRGIS